MSILRIREKLIVILNVKDSPLKTSLSFGIGVFIGISPLLGLHTILGVIVSILFKLNKFITLIGVYVNNPWTIVPIYTFATWVGLKITGRSFFFNIKWNKIKFYLFLNELKELLWPFIIGSTLVGLVSGIAGFIVIFYAFKLKSVATKNIK